MLSFSIQELRSTFKDSRRISKSLNDNLTHYWFLDPVMNVPSGEDLTIKPRYSRLLRPLSSVNGLIVTGKELLEGHKGGALSVVFSADGARIVSGSNDKTIRVWDADTGKSAIESPTRQGRVSLLMAHTSCLTPSTRSFGSTLR
ncbi:hypothetical protein HD554DRAFT_686614 [Boletus coccyginus]|nr:hypothetical protein HD554DRAFT_686614 [Boletus coccyginus]